VRSRISSIEIVWSSALWWNHLVNHCHYEGDTTIIQMALSIEIHGLCFYVWFVGQIIDSNGCTLAFFEYNPKCMYFRWTRKIGFSKINLADQFDHVSVKKWD